MNTPTNYAGSSRRPVDTTERNADGPRERLAREGAGPLSDAELLAVLIGTGTENVPVTALAARLLVEFGGLTGLTLQSMSTLCAFSGVGIVKACRLLAAVEIGRRIQATPLQVGDRIRSSRDIDQAFRSRLAHLEQEQFLVIALDSRKRIVKEVVIAKGSLSECPVSAAQVFRMILRENAAAAILVHNHPSGEVEPSREDIAFTQRLCFIGDLVGISILDHVIVGRAGYFSFVDAGVMQRLRNRR